MKEYKYLYSQMLSEDTIRKAYKKLRKGKTKRREIQKIDANLDKEVEAMRLMIENTKPPDVFVERPELAFKPKTHKPKIIVEHGKERKIYMPEIHEQWLHHIIVLVLEPIIMSTAYRYSCGSLPKRGSHYGKKQIEKWIKSGEGIRNYAKMDIRHFYKNIKSEILMRELRIRIKDEWFLHIISLCLKEFKKGVPLGFYISQWLANYFLEPLDKFITETLGLKKDIRYMDDITIFDNSKKRLHKAIIAIKQFIGRRLRLKLKNNYQVNKFHYKKKDKHIGHCLDFMGFLFYRDKTLMRKNVMLSATRLAKKMHKAKEEGRGYFVKHIKALLSYMGWFTCTNTYDCYKEYIKPYVTISKLKRIISKLDRRKNHERLDRGKMFRKTRGTTACCA